MKSEQLLRSPLSQDMRAAYQRDVEAKKSQHNERRRDLQNGLLKDKSILFLELFMPKPGWPSYLEKLHPERRSLIEEGLAGGPHSLQADIFAHQMGFTRADIESGRFQVWKASHGEEFPKRPLTDYALIIASGSDSMVTWLWEEGSDERANQQISANRPWLRKVVKFSRELSKHNIPALYVCLGHQIYAASWSSDEAMPPDIKTGRKGAVDWIVDEDGRRVREFGPVTLQLTEEAKQDPLLLGLGQDYLRISASHSQHVPEHRVPDNAMVLAYSKPDSPTPANPNSQTQMMRYRNRLAWGIQNHPEAPGSLYLDPVADMRHDSITDEIGERGFEELKYRIATFDTNKSGEIIFRNILKIANKALE